VSTEKLATLWAAAMSALAAAQSAPADVDDLGMESADADSLFGWVDDLQDRVGLNVDDFRSAIEAYASARYLASEANVRFDPETGARIEYADADDASEHWLRMAGG
jgi:hypothetical protein